MMTPAVILTGMMGTYTYVSQERTMGEEMERMNDSDCLIAYPPSALNLEILDAVFC